MLVADTYVGHRDDPVVADRLVAVDAHRVVLSDTDRRRSRVRTETVDGRDLGVVVGRVLADGDVLKTDGGDLVVVELAAVEALVVDFADADASPTDAVALGHAAGNRHWNLAVRGAEALFLVTESHERMERTVDEALPDGVAVRYDDVPPTTFDDGGPDHSHAHGDDDHSHGSGDAGHGHSHDREADPGHGHAHSPDREADFDQSHDHGVDSDQSHDYSRGDAGDTHSHGDAGGGDE